MRLRLLDIAIDGLNDLEEEVDFTEKEYDEFIEEINDIAWYFEDNVDETLQIMEFDNKFLKTVFK